MNDTGAGDKIEPAKSEPAGASPVLPASVNRDLFGEIDMHVIGPGQKIIGLVIVRSDGTIIHTNSYLAHLVGRLPKDMEGEQLVDSFAPKDKEAVASLLRHCLTGDRSSVQLETAVTDTDGETVHLLINALAVEYRGLPAAVGVVININVQKRAEAALRSSEAKYANALRMVGAGGWEYDLAEDVFVLNDTFYLMCRTTAEAVGGYTMTGAEFVRHFMHPDDIEGYTRFVNSSADRTEQQYYLDFEHRVLFGDGTTGNMAVRSFISKDKDGRVQKIYGVNQDITKRVEMEKSLAASEGNLKAALSNMLHGLLMFDGEGRLVLSNPRVAEIYGVPSNLLLPGMTLKDLLEMLDTTTGHRDLNMEETLALMEAARHGREGGTDVQQLSDHRSIGVSFRPMVDNGLVLTFEDITRRLESEAEIRHMAQFDALTNLRNRASFYDQMDTIMKHLRRGESIGVLSLDLDHFKAVNDTLGHPIGDRLLQEAARRMESCLRASDIVARLGGDEFAVLQVPAEQPLDITALANRLIEVVGAPYLFDDRPVIVGISVGVAVAPGDGTEPDILMKNADLALYRAKADGGSVCRFFETGMDARMQARRSIELDLRRAIQTGGEFLLHYQPVVDVKTGKVSSCEALLRWNSPERGLVMPDAFIPVAEATRLIVPLGEWVLHQACADAARWPDDITIAVNLSPAQLSNKDLVPSVRHALAESGLPASRLELEVTERVLLNENAGAIATLHQLRSLGIRIAMDDFGTGYSSLGYLRKFPFNTIKIDQSFIRDLPDREDSLAIVRAVIGLSSSLGIVTIAEGVETRAQLASITSEGCKLFQGRLFSKPRPNIEVEAILQAQAAGRAGAFSMVETPEGMSGPVATDS